LNRSRGEDSATRLPICDRWTVELDADLGPDGQVLWSLRHAGWAGHRGRSAVEVQTMASISQAETVAMLHAVPLFSGLSRRQLAAVAKLVDHVSFEPGAVIVKELDVGHRLIVIREGTAEVVRRGIVAGEGSSDGIRQGDSRRLATLGPGEVVGELSLIDGRRTSASVVAETAVEALALYRTRFNKLFESTPQLARNLLVSLATRVRETDRRANLTG
jgi:CRP/FNR family cyclic AMP-dependent transcriptional regulator